METQTRTSGAETATLGLGTVLVGSLPAALMTDRAPDRYTAEADFTRRLGQIGAGVRARQDAGAVRFRHAAPGEQERAAAVAVLTESVIFRISENRGTQPDRRSTALDDRARIDDWTDEGGHGR